MAAKDYADNARRLADRASGISVVIFVGLLVSVLSDFRPKLATSRDAVVAEAMLRRTQGEHIARRVESGRIGQPRNIDSLLAAANAELDRRGHRIAQSTLDSSIDRITKLESEKENRDETRRAYQRSVGKIAALSVVRDAQRRAIENVRLKGFGFELGVRGSWASIVWLLILFLGLLNLCVARFGVAGELRKATAEDERLFDTFRVPLWLFPISGAPQAKRNALLFIDTFTLAIVLVVGGCVVAAAWMARLALTAPLFLEPGHSTEGIAASITVACLAAGIAATLSLWAVPVPLVASDDPSRRAVRRRMLLALPILVAVASAATIPPRMRRLLQRDLLKPRRRRRVRGPLMASGFYAHRKTGKIHYVPSEGHAKSLRGAKLEDFVKLDAATLTEKHRAQMHVKSLVPYARQVVHNLKRDYTTSAEVLMAILGREAVNDAPTPVSPASAASAPTVIPAGHIRSDSAAGRTTTRARKGEMRARSHGKTRRSRSRRRSDERVIAPQLVQVADLLARLGARARQPAYWRFAFRYVDERPTDRRIERLTFVQRMDEIKEGTASRLASSRRFTLRRLEAAIQQVSETAERRKYEAELRDQIAKQAPLLDDDARLELRVKRRQRIWFSRFWTSDFNRKVRLMRHRGRRHKREAEIRG